MTANPVSSRELAEGASEALNTLWAFVAGHSIDAGALTSAARNLIAVVEAVQTGSVVGGVPLETDAIRRLVELSTRTHDPSPSDRAELAQLATAVLRAWSVPMR
jgi:predicted metal-dependent hydrolase